MLSVAIANLGQDVARRGKVDFEVTLDSVGDDSLKHPLCLEISLAYPRPDLQILASHHLVFLVIKIP